MKGRKRCRPCAASGRDVVGERPGGTRIWGDCPACKGHRFHRGYQRILSEPEKVIAEQEAIAGGVMG